MKTAATCPCCLRPGPPSVLLALVSARAPGQAAELDAFFGQRLGLLVGGLAIDAALVALAVVDLARFLGELRPDMLAVLLDLLAQLQERLAHLLGHMLGQRRHLLLLRGRCRSGRRCGLRLRFDHGLAHLVTSPADARRHAGARHLAVAAHGAADQGLLFLSFVGLAVLEPALELVALGAAQSVKKHEMASDSGYLSLPMRECKENGV